MKFLSLKRSYSAWNLSHFKQVAFFWKGKLISIEIFSSQICSRCLFNSHFLYQSKIINLASKREISVKFQVFSHVLLVKFSLIFIKSWFTALFNKQLSVKVCYCDKHDQCHWSLPIMYLSSYFKTDQKPGICILSFLISVFWTMTTKICIDKSETICLVNRKCCNTLYNYITTAFPERQSTVLWSLKIY